MSITALRSLKEQRDTLVSQMRDHITDAEKREGGWVATDDETIAKYESDIAELDQRSDTVMKAMERAGAESEDVQRALDADERRNATPDVDGFEHKVRDFLTGKTRSLTIAGEKRDLTKGSAGAGGNTVETSFYDTLVEHMIESSAVLRSGATILRTDSGEDIQIPTTTTHPTATLVSEGGAISESDPVFAQRTLGAYKYAVLNQVSSELIEDTSVDLLGYLARACGRAVGNAFGAHAITGDGSSKPTGIVQTATTGVTGAAAAAGVFTADNLIDLYYSVIEEYRNDPTCSWLLRDASVATMRKLKDDNNQYLWNPATEAGKPDSFLGKPVVTDPNVAAVAATAKSVIFGAMSAYFVRQVNEIRFERSDDFAFANDLVTFRCIARMDGITVDQTGALKVFAGGAAS